MNSSYALEHNCALLEQSKTLETLFRLTCGHGDADAALFLENGEEKRWSYRQYEAMTRQYAACLRRAFPEEGYIAISVDTCKEWFPLFWGVILSGRNALLIDAACAGNAEAVERVLQHYDGYINKLCTRTLYDGSGQPHICIDEYMKRRLQIKLIHSIVSPIGD